MHAGLRLVLLDGPLQNSFNGISHEAVYRVSANSTRTEEDFVTGNLQTTPQRHIPRGQERMNAPFRTHLDLFMKLRRTLGRSAKAGLLWAPRSTR